MLALAGIPSGAHPFFVTPDYPAEARDTPFLGPEQAIVIHQDSGIAREVARADLASRLGLSNCFAHVARLGFTEADLAGSGSDRLVDAMLAHGSASQVASRVGEHLAAGAGHVAMHPLAVPGLRDHQSVLGQLRLLADELAIGGAGDRPAA